MCGIAVVINGQQGEVEQMGEAIKHRGRSSSITQVRNVRVYFTHLPITDANAPAPPWRAGNYYVWLNGYISNYKELAEQYDIQLDTDCDTELLAKFIQRFRLQKLDELNGFFAVVWVKQQPGKQSCHAGWFTDRYGIKQLYNYRRGITTYLCSEVKGIRAIAPDLEPDAERVADCRYSLGVMSDRPIFKGITLAPRIAMPEVKKLRKISYERACVRLRELLQDSFNRNYISDKTGIKTAVLLSGGVDSGLLAAKLYPDYCLSMDYLDERSELENIKRNSHGEHLTMICNPNLYFKYRGKVFKAVDDVKVGSCYTNYALTELAAKLGVTVLYSGAGGDEVFNGYTHRYNKPINQVIKRTDAAGPTYEGITHEEYDWKYLRGILMIEDRIAGYHCMETRYPLLDNELVNFALSLPDEYLADKRILRDVCDLHPGVAHGPKRGFTNPYVTNAQWVEFGLKELGITI